MSTAQISNIGEVVFLLKEQWVQILRNIGNDDAPFEDDETEEK